MRISPVLVINTNPATVPCPSLRLSDDEVASKVDAYRSKLMSEVGRKDSAQKRDEFGRVQ